ncbi:hypothetical protein [Crateriforma conspicua]|uniref:hypothetical protein n=1 Tax=Crateriforma conspicua TaxID=2527996 RepID=UPI0011A3E2AE|nr:hypothetical protein [Crateriforma conspicua]
MHTISTPRLVIRFEGKPASNVTLILPDGDAAPYQLDGDGSITAREIGWRESLILLPKPDGGGVSVGFPQHGTKVIDFQGRMTTTTIVQYFGLVSNQSEAFTLTDADIADIESGRKSSAEIVEEIRRSKSGESK